jgi:hypothetical protein
MTSRNGTRVEAVLPYLGGEAMKGSRTLFMSFVVVAGVLGFSSIGIGQVNKGSLDGIVTDASSAAVPGAQVTLTETLTHVTSQTTTDSTGGFTFANLDRGSYEVTVTHPGFETSIRSGIDLSAGDNKRIDFSLQVGQVSQTVDVSAAATALLETRDPTYTDTVETSTLKDLPLVVNGLHRDPSQYLAVIPGYQGGAGFSNNVNGSIGSYGEITVDGAPLEAAGPIRSLVNSVFSNEIVAEFKVIDSPTADLGNSAGDAMSFVTKSGTNQWHGSLYEYLRNNDLDSRSYFATTVPKDIQNEYGGSLGGPIFIPHIYNGKDKTFFFFNYGQTRYRFGGAPATYTMPIEAFRQGDFSSILGPQIGTDQLGRPVLKNQIYNPNTTRSDGMGGFIRDPFPGNIIPQSAWSSVSSKFQAYYPTLSANAPLVNNYLAQGGAGSTDNYYYSVKIDHSAGPNHFSGLYWEDHEVTLQPFTLPAFFEIEDSSLAENHDITLNWARTFSQSVVNNVTFAVNRANYPSVTTGVAGQGAALIGQPNALGTCTPQVSIAGFFASTETQIQCGLGNANTDFSVFESLSYTRGRHFFKFGGDWEHWNQNAPITNNGHFGYTSSETALPGALQQNTGFPYASFLLGQVDNSMVQGYRNQSSRAFVTGLYAQDSLRATPKLSLDLGLRWDIQPQSVDAKNNVSAFNASLPNPGAGNLPGAMTFIGSGPGRLGRRRFVGANWSSWGPRIGFAYHVEKNTVVRGSWGLFYGPVSSSSPAVGPNQQGFFPSFSLTTQNGFTPVFNWDQGYPVPPNPDAPTLDPTVANGGNTAYYGPNSTRPPRIETVRFGIQHEFPGQILVEGSFIGKYAHGIFNFALFTINQLNYQKYGPLGALLNDDINSPQARAANIPIPYAGFTGTVSQALRPFPQYNTINDQGGGGGNATYNSFQLKVQKNYGNGISFLVGYTISKTLTDTSSISGQGQNQMANVPGYFAAGPQDAYNLKAERGLGDVDIPQAVIFSYTYELPVGPGKRFVNHDNMLNRVTLGGWGIAGYQSYYAGAPISPITEQRLATQGGALAPTFLRPNLAPGAPIRSNVGCGSYVPGQSIFNVSAFSDPAPLSFGDSPRTIPNVRTCGISNENFTLLKKIPIRENIRFELGGDFFNILNRHPWGAPNVDIDGGAFGTFSSTLPGRIVQVHTRLDF